MKHLWIAMLLSGLVSAHAQKIVLMPMKADSVGENDLKTIQDLFAEQLQILTQEPVTRAVDSLQPCGEVQCAIDGAKASGANRAVYGAIRRLGRQMFFSAGIVDAGGGSVFHQRLGVASVEDFEPATRRMAESLLKRKTLEEVATVDNITASEETKTVNTNRRSGYYLTGVSLGYAWPTGTDSYTRNMEGYDYSCDAGGRCGYYQEEKSYRQIIRMGWNNWFEFKPQTVIEIDALLYAPIALGADVNYLYFTNRSDFSPFFGGGLGLHYVFPDDFGGSDKRNSGPALNVQAGLVLFRTYDYNLFVRGQYHFVANSDRDQAAEIDIGVRTRMGGSDGSGKYHRTSATTWIGGALGAAYIIAMIVAASSGN